MRVYHYFLFGLVCAAFVSPGGANVATTAGSNLTAYNGTGATNNNKWNTMMNARGGMSETAATANFGNCNAVVLRCATPKCTNGACYDMSVARPIVAGCVNSNSSCKKHGDELIDYITAQIVAQSNAKQQEQQNAVAIAQAQAQAQAAAASAAAEQSNAQMQQMQQQMAEMQQQMAESMANMQAQMAAQSESQSVQIQNALEEQRNSYSTAVASDSATGGGNEIDPAALEGLTVAEQLAIKNGVSPDLLVREQVAGKIETAIDNATVEMKKLKEVLDRLLEYGGCDSAANNCTGPKRVKKFKDLANEFFDPYEAVVDDMYEALMLAMTVGIDVSDVIMLLSDSCNMWGKYMCGTCDKDRQETDAGGGVSVCECNETAKGKKNCYWRVAFEKDTGKVAKNQPHCRLMGILDDKADVQREWIDANTGMTGSVQVACASDFIGSVGIFRGRRKNADADVEMLRDLVAQDSSTTCSAKDTKNMTEKEIRENCGMNACMVATDSNERKALEAAFRSRKLDSKNLCYDNKTSSLNNLPFTYITPGDWCSQYTASDRCEAKGAGKCEWVNYKCVSTSKKVCSSGYRLDSNGNCVEASNFIGPPTEADWLSNYEKKNEAKSAKSDFSEYGKDMTTCLNQKTKEEGLPLYEALRACNR
ncbi:MAG: hypothetical protein J6T57_02630 [Alphaproteobacteria bacterium]|nr:hypothetical protein [Alphaproteobacteria bacterium]